MAVDEMLLGWSAAVGRCCLRLYGWEPATLSLGYFQAYEDRRDHAASLGCPVVRRPSGGGAIVHDAELTYSFVVPSGHRLAARRLHLYHAVHRALVEVVRDHGVEASVRQEQPPSGDRRQPFLCFQRRAPGDVVAGEIKIAGSAQRRTSGAVLQHGSVLLARSAAAPELPGLDDLMETPLQRDQLAAAWLEKLGEHLGLAWQEEPLARGERRQAARLAEAKYANDVWTKHRGRKRVR